MTALNNDVGAVAFFSLFLWGSTRLLKRGFSVGDFVWALAAVAVCLYTKNTAFIALPVFLIVMFFTLLRQTRRIIVWGLIAILVAGALAVSLTWSDPASWYRSTPQPDPIRAVNSQAVLGTHVLQLDASVPATPTWMVPIYQFIPLEEANNLKGRTVTFGVWMWASRSLKTRLPVLHNGPLQFTRPVDLTVKPTFQAITATLSTDYGRTWVTIAPKLPASAAPVTIYYDGFVLAKGVRPIASPPQFSASSGEAGQWGDKSFVNFMRNPSIEQATICFRPWLDRLGASILPDHALPSLILASLIDPAGIGWQYRNSALNLFRTFWGLFGWGDVPLRGSTPYRWLAVLTLLAFSGLGLAVFRFRRKIPWELAFVFSLVLLGTWGYSLVRASIYPALYIFYLPSARYAGPAIIVTMLALNLGWLAIFSWLTIKGNLNFIYKFVKVGSARVAQIGGVLVYLSLFAWLDFNAIYSIWVYFH
jgi:hypothetical protein